MVTSYRITEEHTLSNEWGKLQQVKYETSHTDGKTKDHKAELYDVGNGVSALLYNVAKGTVLLIRQFRLATVRNGNPAGLLTEACAGKVDNLSAEETIIKEIREETGYAITEVEHIMSLFPSPGSFTERLELYIAAYEPKQKVGEGGGVEIEGEDIEVLEIPFHQTLQMIKDGVIRDAKTIILLQYVALNGLFAK
jgi:nudix-type nucleoside diphosphatase (YffH/AdpP family)